MAGCSFFVVNDNRMLYDNVMVVVNNYLREEIGNLIHHSASKQDEPLQAFLDALDGVNEENDWANITQSPLLNGHSIIVISAGLSRAFCDFVDRLMQEKVLDLDNAVDLAIFAFRRALGSVYAKRIYGDNVVASAR